MKGKFLKKLLALSLSASMVLGNVAPVYATETVPETAKADAPTITLDVEDDGTVRGLYVQNNDEEYSCVYYGLATLEEIEAGEVEYYSGEYLENSETGWTDLREMIRACVSESGEYYLVAEASNDNEAISEMFVLEDYPIAATVTSMEEALEYREGTLTERIYFMGKSADEYDDARVQVNFTDEWEYSWTDTRTTGKGNGMFYLHTESLNEGDDIWSVTGAEFYKISAAESGCTVEKEVYTSVTEGEAYEETKADAPTITLEADEEGNINAIITQNNDESSSWICYGAVTREELTENASLPYSTSVEGLATSWDSLEWLIENISQEGEYYFAAYAYNENEAKSEVVVLEDFPITVTEMSVEEPLVYQSGVTTNHRYFTEKSTNEYDYARVMLNVSDEEGNSWEAEEYLETRAGMFYLDTEHINENYEGWSVARVEFCKIDATEAGCTAEKEIYATLAEGEPFEEAKAEVPEITLEIEEDENINGIYVKNNDEEYSCVYYGLATEEEIEAGEISFAAGVWIGSMETSWTDLNDIIRNGVSKTGEYYFVADTYNENKGRSELFVLEDYPVTVTVAAMEETLEYHPGEFSGCGYFTEKSAVEYDYAEVEVYLTDEWEDSWTTENLLNERNGMFYLDVEYYKENYVEWLVEKAEFCKLDVEETGCTVAKEIYTSIAEGEPYEEVRAEAPTITLNTDEDGSVNGINVQNNDEEYSCVYYGLATAEEIEAGEVSLNSCTWLEAEETSWTYFNDMIINDASKTGEYYFVADTYHEDKARSELVVLEDYPVMVTVTSTEEMLEYHPGEFSGCGYFTEKSTDEYVYAEVDLLVTDEWEDSWTTNENLDRRNGMYYLDTERLNEEYEAWTIENVEFYKIDAAETGCTVAKEIYTSVAEGEPYEEARAEAPTILLDTDEDGTGTRIKVQNNDEEPGWVYYGLATVEEIESGEVDYYSYAWLENSEINWGAYLDDMIESEASEPGEYYFVAYTENESEIRSELTVKEDYPVIVTSSSMEEVLEYQIGNFTGYGYFTGISADAYDYANAELMVSDEWDDSWTTERTLYKRIGMFYFEVEDFNEAYDSWSVEKVELCKINATESGCMVEKEVYTSIAEGEIYDEPKAPAPTLELYRDDNGNVAGVEITNHITNDTGRLFYGYFWGDDEDLVSSKFLKAGEKAIILFDELFIPVRSRLGEEVTFGCWALDRATGLHSETAMLDYQITFETQEYTGDTITVYMETDEENKNWYYMDATELPENINELSMNILDWSSYNKLKKLNKGTHWGITVYYEITIQGMEARKIVAEEAGMKLVYIQIPQEKITVETRDFSSKEVLLLDYDHYNAFVASGGSITVDENAEVVVSTDNFVSEIKWTLEYLYQKFTASAVYTLVKNIADDIIEMANAYWKTDVGSFQAINYYDTEGNLITEDSISEHDVVLIEYAPEIVWVDSMELKAPQTMEFNETATITADLDAGQDKYPFGRTPQIRYESSNPEVVAVDANTGALTSGKVNGTATITAYADEILRAEEGLDEIVTASVEITVSGAEEPKTPVTEAFNDVPEGSWYIDSVQYVYDKGILVGDGNVFNPEGATTRAMVSVILYRMAGSPAVTDYTKYNEFNDLPAEHLWYSDAVAWALNEEISTGDDYYKMYNPNSSVTREQLALFFWRYAKYKEIDVAVNKTEAELLGGTYVNSWAKDGFMWALDKEIIKGSESIGANGQIQYDLLPQYGATRAQLARMMQRFCEKYNI